MLNQKLRCNGGHTHSLTFGAVLYANMSQKLVQKRSTLKNIIARTVKFAKAIPDDCTLRSLQTKLELLEQNYELCFNTHLEVMELTGEAARDFEEMEFESIQELYEIGRTLLEARRDELNEPGEEENAEHEAGVARAQVPAPIREIVKLPVIHIPPFSGEYSQWKSFRDLFLNAIGDRRDLSGAQKLHYLKSFVTGEAAQLVRAYSVTDGNYRVAWGVLDGRYDNKRLLMNAYMKRLFDQPTVAHESATSLRELMDTTTECAQSLAALDLPVEQWDAVLVYIVVQRLDSDTHKQWEISLTENDVPTYGQLMVFMERRCRSLEAYASVSPTAVAAVVGSNRRPASSRTQRPAVHHAHANPFDACAICSAAHAVIKCPQFQSLTVPERRDMVKSRRLCFLCLKTGHISAACKQAPCTTCAGKHNTMLHMGDYAANVHANAAASAVGAAVGTVAGGVQSNFGSGRQQNQVLLSTAYVKINGEPGRVRVLMDNGSQVTLIRESCVQRFGLRRTRVSVSVGGLGDSVAGTSKWMVELQLRSCVDESQVFNVMALVLCKLTNHLPGSRVTIAHRPNFEDLQLADPTYYEPGDVEMILGADICGIMMRDGLRMGSIERGREMPTAQNTALGWVLTGPVPTNNVVATAPAQCVATAISLHVEVESDMRRFWQIEEVSEADRLSEAERVCEAHFEQTHRRNVDGRYVVRLPFTGDPAEQLGDSRDAAERRLRQIEKRLGAKPDLRRQYCEFMREYAALGHMRPATRPAASVPSYYLPHHFVIKESSSTTRLRVVFDASCRSTSGKSLNDVQLVGPKLQDDLAAIVLRFRRHAVALTADIAKMYRQVAVHEDDWDFQRILWRDDVTDAIQEWQLKTVTYGMAASPFLAVRALRQLAMDERPRLSEAAHVVLSDFYVDDLITGCDSSEEAIGRRIQLCSLMSCGGFELRKWSTNCARTMETIPEALRESVQPLRLDDDAPVKTLGLLWYPAADCFAFKVESAVGAEHVTKRSILSAVSRLFDPLGLLAPSIIVAKILIQQLWTLGVAWDEDVPDPLRSMWIKYHTSLTALEQIQFPRWIGARDGTVVQLHGFADASESAYGGVIYARCQMPDGQVRVSLLTAKTKVAPLQQITLPRLELCAAVLVSKLLRSVMATYGIETTDNCVMWSDSQVTLSWIRKAPRNWKTFVANRVSAIQSITPPDRWRYVPTAENPADCLSRGVFPAELVAHHMWLHGPAWVAADESRWPKDERKEETHLDERVAATCMIAVCADDGDELLQRYSSLGRLLRITALVCRFAQNCRAVPAMRRRGIVTVSELREALLLWVLRVQSADFADEITCCLRNVDMPKSSKLRKLKPYLDGKGMLRLGGRLRNADLSEDAAHPVVLMGTNPLTSLIITDAHLMLLHGGAQVMLNYIRQRYWILGARGRIRNHVRSCITCFRQQPRSEVQQMGDLPRVRVTPSRAFFRSGVDYAGPMAYKSRAGRGFRTEKGYVALFVCLSTRAIHLEFVSDLSTVAFLAAFRRFVARRGRCGELMSDNATNFVGARRQLGDILQSHAHNEEVARILANDGTTWRMIPPRSPHFGGLWEAGVKAVKHHLRRVIGQQLMTFEEFTTMLAEIEAVLNSRPLCALSDDPSDLTALTPGHFLVGGAPVVVPDHDVESIPMGRLNRWQLVSQMVKAFWKRWRHEYLASLQQRNKWTKSAPNVEVGQLALLKDELLPPTKWRLARVIGTQPGDDGHVRVVSLKHSTGVTTRAITRICILPINTDA